MIHRPDRAPPAFVVGACAHGLAVARALARSGVEVHILEADRSLPGLRTRYGTKHLVADINGPGLADALLELRARVAPHCRPVLFLMNDRMVRTIATLADRLAVAFRLSWQDSAAQVAALTDKTHIAQRCREAGLDYPQTLVVQTPAEFAELAGRIDWPRILKPARPLSGFKVHLAESAADALAFLSTRAQDFPVLVQQWIPGDEGAIRFSALYLDCGQPLARFDGRKLRAVPMGHTTVAEPLPDDRVFDCAERFFAGTGISGPVSLELKFDPSGRPWVIEPTVGRTDFWIDLCIANGVDLPVLEYRHQAGQPLPVNAQVQRAVWINAYRDYAALPWYVLNARRASRLFFALRFTYLDWTDRSPFWTALEDFGVQVVEFLSR